MAIVKMKRVTMVGAADLKDDVLSEVMSLGAMHIEPIGAIEETPADLASRLASARRARAELNRRAKQKKIEANEKPSIDPKAALDRIIGLMQRRAELESRRSALAKEISQAEPWGDVNPEDIELLKAADLKLIIGQKPIGAAKDLPPMFERAAWWTSCRLSGGRDVGVAAVFPDEVPENLSLDDTPLPLRPLGEMRSELENVEKELGGVDADMDNLARDRAAIVAVEAKLADSLALLEAKLTLGGDKEIFAVTGWCPEEATKEFESLPKHRAFATLVDDPEDGEEPPIALKNGPFVSFFEPLLKNYSLPKYSEGDPTVFFMPFMTAFFGFCLGDVAYGILLFILATFLGRKFKIKGEGLKAVRLMQVLGVSATVVGVLTGVIFGEKYYEFLGLNPKALLFNLTEDPQSFFYLALGFGALQLSIGIIIQLIRLIKKKDIQGALARIGWLSILPGIAVVVVTGNWAFLIIAGLLVFFFESPSPKILRRIGGGAWAVYNISGLLGDVMSYARIFGLGLSTGIIGHVINVIAMAAGGTPYIGWIFTLIILVVGHSFNFAMAVIGSIVHPARLQFLEFFKYFFEGGGVAYRPFSKTRGG
jgi:V/A-type H+-transporting ATPase subunit I